jgi:hypothetical protein
MPIVSAENFEIVIKPGADFNGGPAWVAGLYNKLGCSWESKLWAHGRTQEEAAGNLRKRLLAYQDFVKAEVSLHAVALANFDNLRVIKEE